MCVPETISYFRQVYILSALSLSILIFFAVNSRIYGDDLSTNSIKHKVVLPAIPKIDKDFKPSVLADLSKIDTDAKEWRLALVNDSPFDPQFSMQIVDKEKPRWKIHDMSGELIAQAAIRNNKLLFVWDKKNGSDAMYLKLLQERWHLVTDHGKQYSLSMHAKDEGLRQLDAAKPAGGTVLAKHHGLNTSHPTPHAVTHGYNVPDLDLHSDLFLEVKSPFSDNVIMEAREKKRKAALGRWIEFDLDVNQWLKLSISWMAELNDGAGGKGSDVNLLVHQKIFYSVNGVKNLPASKKQIVLHRNSLNQKIQKDTVLHNVYMKQLKRLESRASQLRGAQRGTKEWSEQTIVGNQVRQGTIRIKAATRRIRKNKRVLHAIQPVESALSSLQDHPIVYRVATEGRDLGNPLVLLKSKGWELTPKDCLPLLGEWTNEEEMHMEVAQGMISTKQADGNQISQYIYKVESITPCSTNSESILKYDRTGESMIVCYFTDGKNMIMRREFVFKDENLDVAHETFYARISDVWTPHTRAKIVTDDAEVFIEEGELKSWEIANKYKWTRVGLHPEQRDAGVFLGN